MKRIAEEIMKAFLLHIKDDETAPSYAARSFTLDNLKLLFFYLPPTLLRDGPLWYAPAVDTGIANRKTIMKGMAGLHSSTNGESP